MAAAKKKSAKQGDKETLSGPPEALLARSKEIRQSLDKLDRHVSTLKKLGVKEISVLVGNLNKAHLLIRGFTRNQIFSKVMVAAEEQGLDVDLLVENEQSNG